MGEKYLGKEFDIHGGGMDLLFPHHECEIAQSTAANGKPAVHYWIHNNMITINGQKMGKSLGNFITLHELFTGTHKLLEQAYSPMTIRFFVLQAHYRSTLDFSNEALQAAQKGMEKLLQTMELIQKLPTATTSTINIGELQEKCYAALNDDLNTPILISHLFVALREIQAIANGTGSITAEDKTKLEELYKTFVFDILGLQSSLNQSHDAHADVLKATIDMLLEMRLQAKQNKDFAKSDEIRNKLTALGITIKDTKDGFEWSL
jgi:cysteinyl-tRNA synthetase